MTHRDELRAAIQPERWDGPTDRGRVLIQRARRRLHHAPVWRLPDEPEETRQ